MLHEYTWSHLRLLASICETRDTKDTITHNWMKLLESHHMSTFPFTLWPICYRNRAVFASPAFVSPKIVHISNSTVQIKIYNSNDVMIICFQNTGEEGSGYVDGAMDKGGLDTDADAKAKRFIKRASGKISLEILELSKDKDNPLNYIVCVGYKTEAVLAILMSIQTVKLINTEYEMKNIYVRAKVDCVTFSVPNVMSGAWETLSGMVDESINVVHVNDVRPGIPTRSIVVGSTHDSRSVSRSVSRSQSIRGFFSNRVSETDLQRYVDALQNKIRVS